MSEEQGDDARVTQKYNAVAALDPTSGDKFSYEEFVTAIKVIRCWFEHGKAEAAMAEHAAA